MLFSAGLAGGKNRAVRTDSTSQKHSVPDSEGICTCCTSVTARVPPPQHSACPLSESKHFQAGTTSQMPPGIPPPAPHTASRTGNAQASVAPKQLYSQLTNTIAGQCGSIPFLAFWFCLTFCSFELVFRPVQRPGVWWKSLPKVFLRMLSDGYKITASWLVPVAAPETPWRQSNMDWKVQDQNAPFPGDLLPVDRWHGH